ncbi:hypothetical protein BJ944DRAFT_154121 [Cunninghamella echinulata]|nr:hypothetical protein BJ944DRAFT_154121 [Cunninghamella echinulata]
MLESSTSENASSTDSENEDHPSSQGGTHLFDGRAKLHWGKTLDKIRLIANIQKPSRPLQESDIETSASLVPYCPAMFDPPFIALSKDTHGRRPINITDSTLDTLGITQWLFRIELQYGDVKWVLRRSIADFVSLHYTLKFKASVFDHVAAPPSFPNQLQPWINSARETFLGDDTRRQHTNNANNNDNNSNRNSNTEHGRDQKEAALQRRKELTEYLRKLLKNAHIAVSYDICEFLEISAISIVQDMGWKGKEGYLNNRINFVTPRFCNVFRPHLWQKEWVIIRDSYIAFCKDIGSTSPTDVLLFGKSFQVSKSPPGILKRYHHHITLSNQFRRIEIKGSKREVEEWLESIKKVQENSPWVKNHRFGSFAPIRYDSKVKWFVDGEAHFNAVAEAILSARTEIYISDWWLSPELYLRRPPEKNQEFRLDRLLERKAREGVMIYIVVYKEMALALTINSAHTKRWLQNLHPNILVQRHPDHRSIDNNVLFWSHHEKIVVVDNRLAFIGGLDLCWGRYDSHDHSLIDYPAETIDYEIFPGQDYSNPRVKDFANVVNYGTTLVDRKLTARMPWHDMTIGVVGPIARDIARHFVQRWNFLKASKGMHRTSVPFLMPKGEYVAARDESKFKGTCRTQLLRSSSEWSSGIEREHSIYNAYMECISKAKHYIYIENQFFVSSTTSDKVLRNKIGQAIVERIKKAHNKGEKFKIFILLPLIPAFEGDLASSDAAAARTVMHFQYVSISRGGNSIIEKLKEAGIEPSDYIGWYCLRNWAKNKPAKKEERTTNIDSGTVVEHHELKIKDETKSQISTQHSISTSNASSSALSTNIQSTTGEINDPLRNQNSNHEEDDDRKYYVSELIYIHDKLLIVDDRIVLTGSDTDMVSSYMDGKEYKASKFALTLRLQLMKEHLGLLDFNDWDRLLEKDNSVTNPNTNTTPKHGRKKTITEDEIKKYEQTSPDQVLDSNGASKNQLSKDKLALDPLSDHFCNKIWRQTAKTNTLVYRDLFRCVPDDTVHTFDQHKRFLSDVPHGHIADPTLSEQDIVKKLSNVRGHLVEFPMDYLKDENMLGSYLRETVTPMIIFT